MGIGHKEFMINDLRTESGLAGTKRRQTGLPTLIRVPVGDRSRAVLAIWQGASIEEEDLAKIFLREKYKRKEPREGNRTAMS